MQMRKSDTPRLDKIHERMRSKLDELYTDLKQLETDLRVASQESSQARKDRIEGFKRSLRDILAAADRLDGFKQAVRDLLDAADKADREWH